MIKQCTSIILGGALVFTIVGCGGGGEKKNTPVDIKTLIETKCSSCHFSSRIFEKKQPAPRWKNIVQRMRNRNVEMITLEEAKRITKYLRENNSEPGTEQEFNEAAEELEWQ